MLCNPAILDNAFVHHNKHKRILKRVLFLTNPYVKYLLYFLIHMQNAYCTGIITS